MSTKKVEDNKALDEFKESLSSITQSLVLLCEDEVFEEQYGFTMTQFFALRRSCADKIREVADNVERVVKDTGIARVTGGSVAVLAGAAALGGLLLAPVTAGVSLALTVGGIVGGVASTATTLTADFIKDHKVKSSAKEVKELLDSLEDKDKVVSKIIAELQDKIKEIRKLYGNATIMDFIRDKMKINKWEADAVKIVYEVCRGIKIAQYAAAVIQFLRADILAMRGFAVGLAAPGINITVPIFGRILIVTASTTAKILSGFFALVGIVGGIWEIVDGAKDINGSKHAEAYRKAANELDKHTRSMDDDLLQKISISSEE